MEIIKIRIKEEDAETSHTNNEFVLMYSDNRKEAREGHATRYSHEKEEQVHRPPQHPHKGDAEEVVHSRTPIEGLTGSSQDIDCREK